jgi:hypothetical protein
MDKLILMVKGRKPSTADRSMVIVYVRGRGTYQRERTSKRIARGIVKVDAGESAFLFSIPDKVIKVDGRYFVAIDLRENEIALKMIDK